MNKNLIFFLLSFSISTLAQNYRDFAFEIFFSRQPSAKTEAMGRILSVNFDPYFVSQSNPANLVATDGIALFYSNSSPLYSYTDATYNYAGASYSNSKFGAFAFNYIRFNTGKTLMSFEEEGPMVNSTYEPGMDLYTLTYSNDIKDWFCFGINANLFVYNLSKSYSNTFFGVGLSRDFIIVQNSQVEDEIIVGTQLKNIFNQSFTTVDEAQADAFPTIFRIGLANTVEYEVSELDKNSPLFAFTLGIEYQDLLNADHRTAYKAGCELSLMNILFVRGGYYYETTIDYGFNSIGQLEEFTYGAGLELDFNSLLNYDFPLVISFDYVSLKQPTYITNYNDWNDFTTFSLIANYRLDSK